MIVIIIISHLLLSRSDKTQNDRYGSVRVGSSTQTVVFIFEVELACWLSVLSHATNFSFLDYDVFFIFLFRWTANYMHYKCTGYSKVTVLSDQK